MAHRRLIRPRLQARTGEFLSGGVVTVVEAGTDTQVDVYAAKTGGDPLAQPLTTNDQGEVSAWADRRIDVEFVYDDNGHLTRYPSGTAVQFASFTESLPADQSVFSDAIEEIVPLTQEAYDQLNPPDPATLYVITL